MHKRWYRLSLSHRQNDAQGYARIGLGAGGVAQPEDCIGHTQSFAAQPDPSDRLTVGRIAFMGDGLCAKGGFATLSFQMQKEVGIPAASQRKAGVKAQGFMR